MSIYIIAERVLSFFTIEKIKYLLLRHSS